jgi:hypothetical protein
MSKLWSFGLKDTGYGPTAAEGVAPRPEAANKRRAGANQRPPCAAVEKQELALAGGLDISANAQKWLHRNPDLITSISLCATSFCAISFCAISLCRMES